MSTSKGTPDAFTTTLAAVLREAVLDQHRVYPKLRDFKVALRAVANLSDDTAERLLNGRTSIRTDYLFHIAELLGTRASVLLAEAERRYVDAPPVQEVPDRVADADTRTSEQASRLSSLVRSHDGAVQDKPDPRDVPIEVQSIVDCSTPKDRPHAI